jgi:beta-lactam-binding protein with PASTA domain
MARKTQSRGGGGSLIGGFIAFAIVLAIIVAALSAVGHVLGLTPSAGEVLGDKPDGWISDHYKHVVWGYVLTIVVLLVVAVLAWLATQGDRDALTGGVVLALALLVVVVLVPVGRRSTADAAARADVRAIHVPDVVGLTAAKARDALDDAQLDTRFRHDPEAENRCRVFAQDPAAGTVAEDGDDVELRCRASVPRVVARRPSTAELRLEDAGFRASTTNPPGDGDESRCHVRSQSRSGHAEPDALVRLRLACRPKPKPKPKPRPAAPAEPAEAAPAETGCDPSYEGACLDPTASDYDCAGGSGDGPEYTGTVTVVGDDHFDLDRDGDGVGCQP